MFFYGISGGKNANICFRYRIVDRSQILSSSSYQEVVRTGTVSSAARVDEKEDDEQYCLHLFEDESYVFIYCTHW